MNAPVLTRYRSLLNAAELPSYVAVTVPPEAITRKPSVPAAAIGKACAAALHSKNTDVAIGVSNFMGSPRGTRPAAGMRVCSPPGRRTHPLFSGVGETFSPGCARVGPVSPSGDGAV